MKPDWELKEEVILSIAWDRPEISVAFNIFTIDEVLQQCVTLQQTQNGTLPNNSIIFVTQTNCILFQLNF